MEVQSSSKISTPSSRLSSKRFLFDKRYGYVYDEWREPAEVALAYGRGMFCIVPLGKALFTVVSESVNLATRRAIEVVEGPDEVSARSPQANLNHHLHQVSLSIKNKHSDIFELKGLNAVNGSSPPRTYSHE